MCYLMNAYKVMKILNNEIYDLTNIDLVQRVIDKINRNFLYKDYLTVEWGSSRIVIVSKDFAVKWDYDDSAVKSIGGCELEYKMYRHAEKEGFAHLFARVDTIYLNKKFFYVMPYVDDVGHHHRNLYDCLSQNEYNWLTDHVNDLHSFNYGFLNGKAVMVDYACVAIEL